MPTRTAVDRAENQLHVAMKDVNKQLNWIKDNGATLEGYIRNYRSVTDARGYSGDGGEAIYAADMSALAMRIDNVSVALARLIGNVHNLRAQLVAEVQAQVTREETSH